jgi:hypothetical protein
MQAALMKRFADGGAAEAFCASRLDSPRGGLAFGTLPGGTDARAIAERAALQA